MLTEKDLLRDLVKNSPINSVWTISNDSWQGLLAALGSYASIDQLNIKVSIDDDSRDQIIQLVDNHNFEDWIVHQSISTASGIYIMNSYDHMLITELDKSFPNCHDLLVKYSDTGLLSLIS